MRIDHILPMNDGSYSVKMALSRRNLETLLLKLDEPDSKRTLTITNDMKDYLEVKAEENEVHYSERAPGPMHPREEAKLATSWRHVFRDGKTPV